MPKKDSKRQPFMERIGVWYLKKLRDKQGLDRIDLKTYILDNKERKAINRIERVAIRNAIFAGVLSSIITGIAGYLADPLIDASTEFFSKENLWYWSIVLGVTIAASLIEILYIYYDVMAKAHALTRAAHLDLFPKKRSEAEIATSIVRAALELPNKKDSDLRIDPKKESSKLAIVLAAVFYKLKVSVSNFILKALVKRMMGRAISRAWLNFLSIPVCAFWNGMVCWLVIREVKVRVLGPSAASEILNRIINSENKLSENCKLALLRAIGSCIVRTADMHPNLEYMYRSFDLHVNESRNEILDDSHLFLEQLEQLEKHEKQIVLKTLIYAAIIDGKINYKERKLLENAFKICETRFDYSKLKDLLKRFRSGKLINLELDN